MGRRADVANRRCRASARIPRELPRWRRAPGPVPCLRRARAPGGCRHRQAWPPCRDSEEELAIRGPTSRLRLPRAQGQPKGRRRRFAGATASDGARIAARTRSIPSAAQADGSRRYFTSHKTAGQGNTPPQSRRGLHAAGRILTGAASALQRGTGAASALQRGTGAASALQRGTAPLHGSAGGVVPAGGAGSESTGSRWKRGRRLHGGVAGLHPRPRQAPHRRL